MMLNLKYPIIQAPMAGATTAKLIATASTCGALGSVAAGYLQPRELQTLITDVKNQTANPFQVNLFVPTKLESEPAKIDAMLCELAPIEAKLGLKNVEHPINIPDFAAQFEVVLTENIPIVSFTFGIPDPSFIQALKKRKVFIIGTATTVLEAQLWQQAGADAIVAQGFEAGGHRGNFAQATADSLVGLMALLPQVVDAVDIPVIAAGGIMDARGFQASLALGATAVQMGTAFLNTTENTLTPAYQAKLSSSIETDTTLTSAFSGKYARGFKNAFAEKFRGREAIIPAYPIQHYLSSPMRKAASQQSATDYMSMWAGQGVRMAKHQSVMALIQATINPQVQ